MFPGKLVFQIYKVSEELKKGYSFKAAGAGKQENGLFYRLLFLILIAKSIASLSDGALGSKFF